MSQWVTPSAFLPPFDFPAKAIAGAFPLPAGFQPIPARCEEPLHRNMERLTSGGRSMVARRPQELATRTTRHDARTGRGLIVLPVPSPRRMEPRPPDGVLMLPQFQPRLFNRRRFEQREDDPLRGWEDFYPSPTPTTPSRIAPSSGRNTWSFTRPDYCRRHPERGLNITHATAVKKQKPNTM